MRVKNKKTKNKKKVNIPIISVTYFFVAVFLGMMAYICHYSATNKQELINNSYNSRQKILTAKNIRGSIYSKDGEILAETVTDSDGEEKRSYPYADLFSHAVGYSTNGRAGVEALGNYYLINSNAPLSEKVAYDVSGAKYPGDDVYTTLDVDIQQVAYNAIGVYKGAIIVTEPSTGKILAMVSKPGFDPNEIDEIWDDLVEAKDNSILLNRTTQGLYPPGSTFKIITALEYIRENSDAYRSYSFNCSGSFSDNGDRINCYHGQSHGNVDLFRSFAKSCNSSFANMGLKLNRKQFASSLKGLMFNEDMPVNINYTKSRIMVTEETTNADMMQVAIGQGTTGMTPIHLNMITSAIANKGTVMKPYLVERVENSSGSVIKQFSPAAYRKLMSEDETAVLTELMAGVVENGTASRLKGLSYTAAGKTGSAEYNNVKEDSHAWFTGFAPAENPEICVTIIIEGAGSGGDYAVPIAKRIFDAYFGA